MGGHELQTPNVCQITGVSLLDLVELSKVNELQFRFHTNGKALAIPLDWLTLVGQWNYFVQLLSESGLLLGLQVDWGCG
jgi:hypothetical protein